VNVHPQVVVPPECGFMLWLHPDWKDCSWDEVETAAFAKAVAECRKFETWGITVSELESQLAREAPHSFAEACNVIYSTFASTRKSTAIVWGDKNNHYIAHVDVLKTIYSEARFVHIVRDVRDIACSYKELVQKSINSEYRPRLSAQASEIAEEWVRNNTSALNAMKGSTSVLVRYENLVRYTANSMSRVFAALGLEDGPAISNISHLAGLDEPTEFLQWKAKLSGPVDIGSVGRYRKELTEKEILEIESVAGELLEEFGYVIDYPS
jgi:hypothetical protein